MNATTLIPPRLRERAEILIGKMKDLSGVDVTEESRRRPVVMARVLVVNALLFEGYTEHSVGSIIGIDHSTVNHYRHRMKEIQYAPGYDAERELWEKFKQEI